MPSVLRLNGFRLGLLLAALAVGSGEDAFGEIRASDKNGLRTEVNGVRGGGMQQRCVPDWRWNECGEEQVSPV